ncbi:hypothetical protein CDL15_Pgr011712 [Punica granatum]|nr:hypothetical protein CDL15_Pgr011712 [Punica granatum]PKI61493.1 hypothetical protein CRG98_018118 [Punica granatum]
MRSLPILFLFDHPAANSQNGLDSNNPKMHRSVHPSTAAILVTLGAVLCLVMLLLVIVKFWCTRPLDRLLRSISELIMTDSQGRMVRLRSTRLSGLDKRSIESLPLFSFSSIKGSKESLECAVCISKFKDAEFLRLLPNCRHAFHSKCIDRWLEGHSSCPLCRSKFEPADLLMSRAQGSDHEIFIQREQLDLTGSSNIEKDDP